MKGYENLKVSIPTNATDLQQAVKRSPNSNGCKLAALADIALGTDVPISGDMYRSKYLSPVKEDHKSGVVHNTKTDEIANIHDTIQFQTTPSKSLRSRDASPKKQKGKQAAKAMTNKLGFKERKKKPTIKSKNISTKKSKKLEGNSKLTSDLPKDIYDFEESGDSVEGTIKPLTHVRTNRDEPRKQDDQPSEPTRIEDAEEESTYSDRDGFFNYNSVESSISDEDDESDAVSVVTKTSSKTPVNVQKKCLIMGRIFKNAKKDSEPSKPPKEEKKKEVIKSMVKKQMNEIFDDLREQERKSKSDAGRSKEHKKTGSSSNESKDNDTEKGKTASAGKSRKSREIISLEAEWGRSIEEIKDLIGGEKRKTQRRCTANIQNYCVETWSSDEYEEFHSSKDIIAMIQESEVKAQRTKNKTNKTVTVIEEVKVTERIEPTKKNPEDVKQTKSESVKESKKNKSKSDIKKVTTFCGVRSEESDFESDWNRNAKRATIKNRRRTIASREDVYEEEEKPPTKARGNKKRRAHETKKPATPSLPAQPDQSIESASKATTSEVPLPKQKRTTRDGKPLPRRKRIASEMLYYWSSSSDEEFGRIKPNENEEENEDNQLEQHGWIVGDSHKKLVTLLAHAKGKKIDDCAVKEAIHKKK